MLSGIFRRRTAVAAAVLVAGSGLAIGVPSLVLHTPHSSAAAATATITLNTSQFGNLTFAKFGGVSYDDQNVQNCTSTGCTYQSAVVPPTITLRALFAPNIATYKDMLSWEALQRAGNPTGRMDATVTLNTSTGTTIATYVLENAWPTNVDLPAGGAQQIYFTVTLTADNLVIPS